MTDLHTHILPGIDDGARNAEESLALLRMEKEQGISTVVLTPHLYREKESPKHFLQRRQKSLDELETYLLTLPAEDRETLPVRLMGAEVAWVPHLQDWDELPELCIGETKNLLLELPFSPWNERMIDSLYDLMNRTGITPVIAHLERYLKIQRPEYVREVLSLGVPVQVSGDVLLHFTTRSGAMKLLKNRQAHIIASDCHNAGKRPPTVKPAMDVVRRKMGDQQAERLMHYADEVAGI